MQFLVHVHMLPGPASCVGPQDARTCSYQRSRARQAVLTARAQGTRDLGSVPSQLGFAALVMPIRCGHADRTIAEKLNGMMDDRFTVFRFTTAIPEADQKPGWPKCAPCDS